MLKIILPFLLFVSAKPQNYDDPPCQTVEDVLQTGGCQVPTCQDKRVSNDTLLHPSDMNETDFKISACFCDPDCWIFDECCFDAFRVNSSSEPDKPNFECRLIHECNMLIFMVESCPPTWNDSLEVDFCERRVSEDNYTYFLDFPVFSSITHTAYANNYCAKCNEDLPLSAVNIELTCPEGLNQTSCWELLQLSYYFPGERKWQIFSKQYFGEFIYFEVFEYQNWAGLRDMFHPRRCRPVVKSCTGNAENHKNMLEYYRSEVNKSEDWLIHMSKYYKEQVEYYEKLLQNYLFHSDNCTSQPANFVEYLERDRAHIVPIYKNIYCALCNGAGHKAAPMYCFDNGTTQGIPILFSHECWEFSVIEVLGESHQRPGPVYGLLIDFYDELGTNGVGEQSKCREGDVFDPIFSKCLPFSCRKGFIKVGGKCVNPESNDTNITNTEIRNCQMLLVKREHIIVFHENNSIYINATGRMYSIDEFQEYDNETYLVCVTSDSVTHKFSVVQSYLSQVIMIISLVSLAVHIAIYCAVAKLRNLPGKNLLSLSVALFMAQTLFLLGADAAVELPILCAGIAIMTHFCFLASFFWMNVMSFDIFRTFASVKSRSGCDQKKAYWRYGAYAWLVPLAVVTLALTIEYTGLLPRIRPGYGTRLCWFNARLGLFVFFAAPLALLLIGNIIFFVLTAYSIYHTKKETRNVVQNKSDRVRFSLYVKLAFIMGLTWIIGFIAALVEFDPLWYAFTILNASQGTFIFVTFSLKRKVLSLVYKKITGKSSIFLSGTTTSSKSNQNPTSTTISN